MPRLTFDSIKSLADLLEQLGGINPRRIALKPPPGRATEKDLIRIHDRTDRLFELVDGALVEKVMGFPESALAMRVGRLLGNFVEERDLGIVAGPDGAVRLMPGLVRIPDVSFIGWDQVPVRGEIPDAPIADLAPALAVEVLSKGNTAGEMERKLKEYFLAGVKLVWFIDPRRRTVQVLTSPDQSRTLAEGQTLDGGDVLPGLALPLRQVFARLPPARGRSTAEGRKSRSGGKRPKKGRPH